MAYCTDNCMFYEYQLLLFKGTCICAELVRNSKIFFLFFLFFPYSYTRNVQLDNKQSVL